MLFQQKPSAASNRDVFPTDDVETALAFSGPKTGTSSNLGSSLPSVEVSHALIDLEGTADNSDVTSASKSHSDENSTCNDKERSRQTNVNTAQVSGAASSNVFDLMSLDASEISNTKVPTLSPNKEVSFPDTKEVITKSNSHENGQRSDKSMVTGRSVSELTAQSIKPTYVNPLNDFDVGKLPDTGKKGRILNSKEGSARVNGDSTAVNKQTTYPSALSSNDFGALWPETRNTALAHQEASSTQNPESLLLLHSEQYQPGPFVSPQQNPRLLTAQRQALPPNAHNLQSLQPLTPAPRRQLLPRGLVPPTNTASPNSRRPFPKDMKSEVDGFDFIRNSSKGDAFSFVNDEIQARKMKPKD